MGGISGMGGMGGMSTANEKDGTVFHYDTKLMFMVEKEIFYSRNFELPKERCVVWTVNDSDEIMNILNMDVYGVVTDIGDKL